MKQGIGFTAVLWPVPSWFLLEPQLNRTTGIHISFFLFAVYTLSRRWKIPGIKLLVSVSCVMAALGTIQLAATFATAVATARSFQQVFRGQILDQPTFSRPFTMILDFTIVINGWVNPELHAWKVEAHFISLV
jgi:hypothetical protein